LVFSPAFVADCLETTIEIGSEYKDEFIRMGGEKLDLVESCNVHPSFVNGIYSLIKKAVI
jgi:ferrochelatase